MDSEDSKERSKERKETKERVKQVEQAIVLMKDLLVSHNDRLDSYHKRQEEYDEKFRQSREDFEFKLNALIDSQIRNESEISALKDSTSDLINASRSQLTRIERLEKV